MMGMEKKGTMKYQTKNVVIGYNRTFFVVGFSLKTQKVYKSADPSCAKRFTAVSAQQFITEHADKKRDFCYRNIRLYLLKSGQPFNPFEEEIKSC